mgnify:CR=1 FL=1
MSRKIPEQQYEKTISYRFRQWLDGTKDPFLGTVEMKPQKEFHEDDTAVEKRKEEKKEIEKHSISDAEYKQKRKKNNSQGIVVKRLDNILIRFAKCCNPLPGDEIIGYVTKGGGVAINRADCPNANVNGDFFKNRLVDVAWSNSEASKFEAEIQIKAVDRRGIINDITHIIAMDKVSLNGISAKKGKDNVVSVNLLVEVNNIDALNTLMKKIKSIPGVENIYRVIN